MCWVFLFWNFRGTGYIGSFTSLELLVAGYEVIIVDNLYNSSIEVLDRIELICGKRPTFYEVDITDATALELVFDQHPEISSVIHFAALKVAIKISSPIEHLLLPLQLGNCESLMHGSFDWHHPLHRLVCRRIIRNTSRILQSQCWRHSNLTQLHGKIQCTKNRLLIISNSLWRCYTMERYDSYSRGMSSRPNKSLRTNKMVQWNGLVLIILIK